MISFVIITACIWSAADAVTAAKMQALTFCKERLQPKAVEFVIADWSADSVTTECVNAYGDSGYTRTLRGLCDISRPLAKEEK
jgi:hypothetical protein